MTSQDNDLQLHAVRAGLGLRPEQVEITTLVPILAPERFFTAGGWPGPYSPLRAKNIALTWSVLLPHQTMRYVDRALEEHWNARGLDWRSQALHNLDAQTGHNLATHEFSRPDGSIYAIAMMHEDGIGPSRLLLKKRLQQLFREGYEVALPEMSCAFAISSSADKSEADKLRGLVERCYESGTRPLAPGIYAPDDLAEAAVST